VLQQISNIYPNARRAIRSLASAIGIPSSTLCRMKKEQKLRVCSMSLKPKLNDDHFFNTLYHCISKIGKNTISDANGMKYKTMYNEVHIEKQFYLVRDGGRHILTADEVNYPTVTLSYKSHIMRVSSSDTKVQLKAGKDLPTTTILVAIAEANNYPLNTLINSYYQ
jgi:hypothetical protein